MALMTITQFFKNLEMCHVFVFLTWEKIPNTSAQCDMISNSLSHLDTMQFFYVPEEYFPEGEHTIPVFLLESGQEEIFSSFS